MHIKLFFMVAALLWWLLTAAPVYEEVYASDTEAIDQLNRILNEKYQTEKDTIAFVSIKVELDALYVFEVLSDMSVSIKRTSGVGRGDFYYDFDEAGNIVLLGLFTEEEYREFLEEEDFTYRGKEYEKHSFKLSVEDFIELKRLIDILDLAGPVELHRDYEGASQIQAFANGRSYHSYDIVGNYNGEFGQKELLDVASFLVKRSPIPMGNPRFHDPNDNSKTDESNENDNEIAENEDLPESYILTEDDESEKNISVILNGTRLSFDIQPHLINNRTIVPMRKIFEALGADVDWDGSTQTITASKGNTCIIIQIDNTVMSINGDEIILDVPPTLVGDRTLVPLRAVSEGLNAEVVWDNDTKTVMITTKDE